MIALSLSIALALAADPQPAEAGPETLRETPREALPPAPLVSAFSTSPASSGPGQALRRDGESRVDPAARFQVVAGAPLSDARLVLYDAQEALVPGDEHAEIGSTASTFRLAPARPLRPGTRYTLRLEGAADREIHDLQGQRFRPLTFPLLTTGEPPVEKAVKRKGKKRKR